MKKTAKAPATPAAIRAYCVYATQIVYQEVVASSAEQAYEQATNDPIWFEPCGSDLTFDRAVQNLESNEFIHIGGAATLCKRCGRKIDLTVNDSNSGDGKCEACEFVRCLAQLERFEHLRNIIQMARSVSANWANGDLATAVSNLNRMATAADVALSNYEHGRTT